MSAQWAALGFDTRRFLGAEGAATNLWIVILRVPDVGPATNHAFCPPGSLFAQPLQILRPQLWRQPKAGFLRKLVEHCLYLRNKFLPFCTGKHAQKPGDVQTIRRCDPPSSLFIHQNEVCLLLDRERDCLRFSGIQIG